MGQRTGLIVVGLLVLVGLAGPVASAQSPTQPQTVATEVEGHVTSVPDELPGVYHAQLELTTKVSGGVCACQQTSVTLHSPGIPAEVDDTVFSPKSYAIHWDHEPSQNTYVREVHVSIGVSDVSAENRSMISVDVVPEAESDSFLVNDRVHPTELALPIPHDTNESASATEDGDQTASGSGASTSAGAANPASTSSAEQVDAESGVDGAAVGTGAGAAGLALVGLAARRFGL